MLNALLEPLHAGALRLPNRVIMAPLTRCRAGEGRVPNRMMADYYAQRASFGMILSEATSVCPMGVGYPDTPGIWSDAQIHGWREVTRAVHEAGGIILLQLWHVGRISDPVYLDGRQPVSASAVKPEGHVSLLRPQKPFETPLALELEEIPQVIDAYRVGAKNAMTAGFDGVEIHGANGYLIDQFLQGSTNLRTDGYGGPIENRSRFLLEVTDAVVSACGADRVGIHLAPRADAHSMGDSDPAALFGHVARELGKRRLAFLCSREAYDHPDTPPLGPMIKREFGGVYIANEGFTGESARDAVSNGTADAVAFGKAAIANPDLVERIRTGAEWNVPDADTFYGGGGEGYLDYPLMCSPIACT